MGKSYRHLEGHRREEADAEGSGSKSRTWDVNASSLETNLRRQAAVRKNRARRAPPNRRHRRIHSAELDSARGTNKMSLAMSKSMSSVFQNQIEACDLADTVLCFTELMDAAAKMEGAGQWHVFAQ
jgi:hypothetical protein